MASTIALITGANTGIGYQIVRALYNSNKAYEILVGGRSLEKAEAAIKAAKTEYPSSQSKLFPIQIDIESDESIHRAVAEVQSKYGRVDTLINNAGLFIRAYRTQSFGLISRRRPVRPPPYQWQALRACHVEPNMERQCIRNASPNLKPHPTPPEQHRPAHPLPDLRTLHTCRERQYYDTSQPQSG